MDNRKDFVGDRSVNANVAIWILMTSSALFLAGRLWCRHRSTKLWWDDLVLSISWVCIYFLSVRLSQTFIFLLKKMRSNVKICRSCY